MRSLRGGVAVLALAAGAASASAQTSLQGLLGAGSTAAVVALPGGDVMLLGGDQEPLVARIAPDGAVVWQARFGNGTRIEPYCGSAWAAGGLLVAGLQCCDSPWATVVGVVTADGEWAWGRSLDVELPMSPQGVAELAGGGIALVGTVRDSLALAVLDPDGTARRATRFPDVVLRASAATQPTRIAATPDGGFVVAAGHSAGPVVLKLDALGQPEWQRRVRRSTVDGQGGLVVEPDGDVVVQVDLPARDGTAIVALDASGSLVSEHEIVLGGYLESRALLGLADGRLALIAHAPPDGGGVAFADAATSAVEAWRLGVRVSHAHAQVGPTTLALGGGGMTMARFDTARPDPGACVPVAELSPVMTTASTATLEALSLRAEELTVTSSPLDFGPLPTSHRGACASCAPDDHEPDDRCGQGLALGIEELGPLSFCDDGEDWFRLEACPGQLVTIETSGLGASADTILEVFDGDCATLLASDDDGAGGRASRLTVTIAAGAHVRVRQADGTTGADREYAITRSVAEPPSAPLGHRLGGATETLAGGLAPDGSLLMVGMRFDILDTLEYAPRVRRLLPGTPVESWRLGDGTDYEGDVTDAFLDGAEPVLLGFVPDAGDASRLTWLDASAVVRGSIEIPELRRGAALAPTAGGGAVVFGTRDASLPPDFAADMAWAEVDGSGSVVAARAIQLGGLRATLDGDRDAAGGLVSVGGTAVARTRPDRSLAWAVESSALLGSNCHVLAADDGGAWLAWSRIVHPMSFVDDAHVARLDSTGAVVWERTIDVGDWEEVLLLRRLPDGTLLVGGRLFSLSTDPPGAFLVALETDGTLRWARAAGRAMERLTLVEAHPDGRLAVAGSSDDGFDVVALELRADGSSPGSCDTFPVVPATVTDTGFLAPVALAGSVAPLSVTTIPAPPSASTPVSESARPACDCRCVTPQGVGEISAPGAATPLRVETGGRITWETREEAGACGFHLLRGRVVDLPHRAAPQCLALDLTLPEWTDAQAPGPGACFYYLVVAIDDSGQAERFAGYDSLGRERRASPCR